MTPDEIDSVESAIAAHDAAPTLYNLYRLWDDLPIKVQQAVHDAARRAMVQALKDAKPAKKTS